MPQSIDELYIEINAKTIKANDAIDRLVGKLNGLTTSLGKLNTSNLNGLANGVQKLGNAMQVMNTVKTADFTRLARNLSSMGNINTQGLNNTASSLSQITRAMNNIGAVSHNAVQLSEMAKNLSKFGGANVQRATVNIPLLANELRKLMMTLSSAPNVSRNIIDMTNALANLSTQGSKVGSASRSIQRSLNGTHSSTVKASKGFNGLASAIGKFYASYFMVIRGVKGIWSSIESTADYIEAYNYFNVALGKIGSDWSHQFEQYGYENAEAYAESFNKRLSEGLKDLSGVQVSIGADGKGLLTETGMKNLGLNIQEVTQYASQLASVTNSVGQTGEVSLATANAFTKLGADMSSLFNVDYSSVMNNLQSGLIGQSRALYKYGIDITNATLQTKAYQLGLTKAVSEMSQMEKQQLRVISILEQSKVSWGDLANTINSPSNLMRIFKNNLKETGMMLGQLFIPMLSKVIPILNGVTIAFKRLLVNIASFMGVELDLDAFGQGYNDLEDDTGSLGDSYDDLAESIKEAKSQLLGFDEVNKLQDTSATATVDAEMGGIDLTDEILKATDEYQKIWQEAFDKMEANSNKWADSIGGAFDKLAIHLEPITKFSSENFENFYNSFLVPLATWTVGKGLPELADIFDDFVDRIDWDDLADDLDDFYKAIEPFVEGFGMGLLHFLDGLTRIGSTAINGIGDALGLFGIAIGSIDVDVIEGVGTALGILVPAILSIKAFSGIGNILDGTGKALGNFVKTLSSHPYATTAVALTTLSAAVYSMYESIIENTEEGKLNARAKEIGNALDSLSDNLDKTLAGIEGKYQYYEDMASKYLTLSSEYDTLSDEDKNLVKQYADELSTYSSEITGYINAITGEWQGTNEQLLEAIKNTREYYKAQAYEKSKVQYYEVMAEAELNLAELQTVFEKDVEQQLRKDFGDSFTIDVIDVSADSGKQYLRDYQKMYRAGSKMYNKIGQILEAWEESNNTIEEAQGKITTLDALIADIEKPELNIDTTKMESDASSSVSYINTILSKIHDIKPNVDDSNAKSTISGLLNKFNNFVADIGKTNIEPTINTTKILDSINYITKEYVANKNTIEKQNISPALVGTSIFNTLTSIKNTYDTNKNTIEKSKIKPTIDSASVDKESKGIFDTITNNLKGIKSTVKVEADSNSLNTFADSIATRIAKIKLAFETKEENGGFFATLKKIQGFATGGFPEDGLFMANHGELVGKFSNGKTAVANNEQITQGIAQAVAPAVYDAFVSAMQDAGMNVNVSVQADSRNLFRVIQTEANSYVAQTGMPPFNI